MSDRVEDARETQESHVDSLRRRIDELESAFRQQCLLLAKASASERKHRELVEAFGDWVWETDAEGRYTYSSSMVRETLGYEPEEVIGKTAFDFMPPDEAERVRCLFFEAVANGRPIRRLQNRNLDRMGREVILETTADVVCSPDGAVVGFRGVDRDVTDLHTAMQERARSDREVRRASKLLEAVLNAIPDLIGVQDLSHRVMRYNEAGMALLGLDASRTNGHRCFEYLGADKPCEQCATTEVYRTQKPARVIKHIPSLNAWFDARSYPVFSENGELSNVVEHLRDITREKQAEEELVRMRDRLQTVLHTTPIPIFAKDRDGRYMFFNTAFERFFDVRNGDLIGKTVEECWPDRDAGVYHGNDMELLRQGGSQVYEHRTMVGNEDRTIVFHKACFHDADGAVAGLVGAIVDVTEQRRLEGARRELDAKMQETQRLEGLGVLAGGVAHDFNNLLMAIMGNADLAAGDSESGSPVRRHLDAIMTACRRAADLCNQMLAFAGTGRGAIAWLDLNDLAEGALDAMCSAVSKGVTVRLEPSRSRCEHGVFGDAEHVRQALLSLALNASEALGPEGGYVTIRTGEESCDRARLHGAVLGETAAEGRYEFIEVEDVGCGMDAETRRRMFEPFFTTKFMGRGLGMAAVLGIVRAHRGIIDVFSDPGRGTRVRMLFPACASPRHAEGASIERDADRVTGKRTILLADDEPSLRTVLGNMLKRSGYDVLTASNGREALALFDRHSDEVLCAILDVSMPVMDGYETLRHLKERAAHMPVILSSGYAREQVEGRLEGKHVEGFIQKPYQWNQLSDELNRVLQAG